MQSSSAKSVEEGLAKLIREVRRLQSEVSKFTKSLDGFKDKHPLPEPQYPYNVGWDWRTRPATEEPQSEIRSTIYEYKDGANLAIPTRTLFAIAKELDGALIDIRAARSDISAIADDSDLRESFKDWQQNQS